VKVEQVKVLKLPTAVLGMDAAPDGKTLYAACMDGDVYEVDVESGALMLVGRHESFASGVVKLPDAPVAVSAGYDGLIQWHDLEKRTTIRKIQAHQFWSWQMALSRDGGLLASVTGQYLCGGYKYEPAPEREPSVKVFDARSGALVREFPHVPPVQAVAISHDGQCVAAGNLIGEVRVYDIHSGKQLANWTTPAFTSWGITKSHCYIGGVYGMSFTPDDREIILCGMGPMRDPMAGNGKQTWQRFAWRENPPKKTDEIHEGDHGGGHPEALAFAPSGAYFVMAGRLAQGKWNTGFFDASNGKLIHSVDAKGRLTRAVFDREGGMLFLAGANGQDRPKKEGGGEFGRIVVYRVMA
jgi:WD40 repeat protein